MPKKGEKVRLFRLFEGFSVILFSGMQGKAQLHRSKNVENQRKNGQNQIIKKILIFTKKVLDIVLTTYLILMLEGKKLSNLKVPIEDKRI